LGFRGKEKRDEENYEILLPSRRKKTFFQVLLEVEGQKKEKKKIERKLFLFEYVVKRN